MESYAKGEQIPLLEKTIHQALDDTVQRLPDHPALISRHQGLRLNYRQLQEHSARTAAGLWALGARPGDRVGMWASSCAEWVYLQVATSRIGAVLVNVNPAYRELDLRYILERSRMKVIFLHEKDQRANYLEILDGARQGQELELEHAVLLNDPSWDRMIDNGEQPDPVKADFHNVVNIQYTSGTTGKPKGVLLTHHNLLNNGYLFGRGMEWSHQDKICLPVPMYHCFGCVLGSLQCIVHGATLVIPAAQFDALAALKAIDSEKCTTVYGVPTMFIAMLDHPDFSKYDTSSLRVGAMGGSPCPVELMKRVEQEMRCEGMGVAYGQTEASPAITQSGPKDSFEVRVSSVGKALPCTEVKIVDPETGETVPVGGQGELCTRGYLVMKGYDGEPEATAKAIDADNWLHTGDLATMREDGAFRITGRSKEMIIRGGENLFPREIEEFLHTHPKIADVYVLGLPDERLGEIVFAAIKLKDGQSATEEEIREFCDGKIAYFKVPSAMRFVDEFPMTVTGKIQKFVIRRQEIERRGLQKAAAVETA